MSSLEIEAATPEDIVTSDNVDDLSMSTHRTMFKLNSQGDSDIPGNIILVNATSSDWTLTQSNSSTVNNDFMSLWPSTISAGTSSTVSPTFNTSIDGQFVQYQVTDISGQVSSFSLEIFTVEKSIYGVRLHCITAFKGFNAGDTLVLGQIEKHHHSDVDSAVCCISNSGILPAPSLWAPQLPSNWMQQTLANLGDLTLGQICLAYSHDSGMSLPLSHKSAGTRESNVQTQVRSIGEQLASGARAFDLRPIYHAPQGKYYAYHGRFLGGVLESASGQSWDDICNQINQFVNQNAELVILEVGQGAQGDSQNDYKPMTPTDYAAFFAYLSGKLHCLFKCVDTTVDLTHLPIRELIGPTGSNPPTGAVIIALSAAHVPLGQYLGQGFYYGNIAETDTYSDSLTTLSQFYYTGAYSNKDDPQIVYNDQLAKLQTNRIRTDSPPFRFQLTCTLQPRDILTKSIQTIAREVHPLLYQHLLQDCTPTTYPNLIGMDFMGPAIPAFAMAINSTLTQKAPSPFSYTVDYASYGDKDVTSTVQNLYNAWSSSDGGQETSFASISATGTALGVQTSVSNPSLNILFRRYITANPVVSYAIRLSALQGNTVQLNPRSINVSDSMLQNALAISKRNFSTSTAIKNDIVHASYSRVLRASSVDAVDVTSAVQNLYSQSSSFQVTAATLGCGPDPSPYMMLQVLMFTYDPTDRVNTSSYQTISARGNDTIQLPQAGAL